MFMHNKASRLVFGLLALTPLLAITPAHAAGTAAGQSIANRATVNYSVGAVAQPAIGSSPTGNSSGAGSDTTFVVDNKIDLNVLETNTAPANTAPGLTTTGTANAVAVFKLSGNGGYAGAATTASGAVAERRGPDRTKNVVRPAFKATPAVRPAAATEPNELVGAGAKTGTDNWESF